MLVQQAILAALALHTTTYGHGEWMCGDVDQPRPCVYGATTASGETFSPNLPTAAVPAPARVRMRPVSVWLRLKGMPDAPCVKVRVNDKKNPRYIGTGGLDLSPEAVRQLSGGRPASATWSYERGLEECTPKGEAE